MGSVQQACDILRRLGDNNALAAALVESGAWNEALALVKQFPALGKEVYLPYARWLAEQEQFIEAQQGGKLLIASIVDPVLNKKIWFRYSLLRSWMFGRSGTRSEHTGYERRGAQQVRRRFLLLLAVCQTPFTTSCQIVSS